MGYTMGLDHSGMTLAVHLTAKPFENAYDADYDYMGRLKAFADSQGICVLLAPGRRSPAP